MYDSHAVDSKTGQSYSHVCTHTGTAGLDLCPEVLPLWSQLHGMMNSDTVAVSCDIDKEHVVLCTSYELDPQLQWSFRTGVNALRVSLQALFTLYSYAFVICVALTVGRSLARSNMILDRDSSPLYCSCSCDSADVQSCSDLPPRLLLSAACAVSVHASSDVYPRWLYLCYSFNQSLEYVDVRTLPMFMSPDAVTRRQYRHSVRCALRLRAKAQRSSTCSVLARLAAVLSTIPALLLLFVRSA